jgi:hypothetical protein
MHSRPERPILNAESAGSFGEREGAISHTYCVSAFEFSDHIKPRLQMQRILVPRVGSRRCLPQGRLRGSGGQWTTRRQIFETADQVCVT